MKELLEETSSKREKLEAELQQLNTHREAIENFDDITAKLKGATLEAMLLEAEAAQRRLTGTAQNRAFGIIEEDSYEDLYSLTGAERAEEDNDD